jgi:hypothetical protein
VIPLVPLPASVRPADGAWEPALTFEVSISDASDDLRALATVAVDIVRDAIGSAASVARDAGARARGGVHLVLDPSVVDGHPEGYRLTIGADGVEIRAAQGAGIFYGLQTLRQVLAATAPDARSRAGRPVPAALDDAEASHVLGAQGNVWTEYLKTQNAIEYMTWPRGLALAEVVWSPRDARDWDSFRAWLPHVLRQLDRIGVNYRPPAD